MKTTEQVNKDPGAATGLEMVLAAMENNVKTLRWALMKERVDIAKEVLDALGDVAQELRRTLGEATQ